MREIKFRAWDKVKKIFTPNFWIGKNGNIRHYVSEYEHEICFEDRYIIQQYTGFKDKNGKEIYEGDIVEYSNWNDETGSQFSNIVINDITKIPDIDSNYCEVIGNIYENPELLSK